MHEDLPLSPTLERQKMPLKLVKQIFNAMAFSDVCDVDKFNHLIDDQVAAEEGIQTRSSISANPADYASTPYGMGSEHAN